MSQKQTRKIINKIWSAIVVFLLLYSFNTLAVVQWKIKTGLFASPLQIFGNDTITRDSILYIGIPVIICLLFVVLYLSNVYYDNSIDVGDKWNQKVPIFLDLDINMSQRTVAENKLIKHWNRLSFIFLILPYLINVQQLYKFFSRPDKAFHIDSGNTLSIFHPTSPLVMFTDQYRYGGANGWTFFPLYIPILFIILEMILLFYFYKYFKRFH